MNCRALLSTVVTTLLFFCSCGGGGSGNSTTVPVSTPTPTPAPAQDFSVSLEAPTVSAQQGGALQLQSLQLSAINGFTGTVSVTLSGLPAGMMVTPDVSFSISVSNIAQNAVFYLGASSTTPVGTTTVTATATSRIYHAYGYIFPDDTEHCSFQHSSRSQRSLDNAGDTDECSSFRNCSFW